MVKSRQQTKTLFPLLKGNLKENPRIGMKFSVRHYGLVELLLKNRQILHPFKLAYGHDVVLPVEISLQSTRIQKQCEIQLNHYWNMMIDELVDLDEEILTALEVLPKQKRKSGKGLQQESEIESLCSRRLGGESHLTNGQEESSFRKMVT